LSYIEKECFKNHRTTAAQVTGQQKIHHEDPISTKTVDKSFINPKSTEGLQLINL
jgi:hypothetical protein